MGKVEEEHAFSLILKQLDKLKKGERLKIGIDIDNTAADTDQGLRKLLEERHGFDFGPSKKNATYYQRPAGMTDKHLTSAFDDVWNEKWKSISPILSREAFLILSERTDLSLVSARSEKSAKPLYSWVSHNYGKKAKLTILNPKPFNMQGIMKLKEGYDILIDDSPDVSGAMNHDLAKGKALLLVDRWDEALENRNPANTAVVANVEHAADLIFEAHEIHNEL
jgi:hypothetical protein